MERYIVRYTKGYPTPQEMDRVKSFPGVQVVNETSKMLLVEATSEAAGALETALPDWSVSAEKIYTVPDPRPQVS